MSFTFKQYDSRWKSHLYPLKNKRKSTMSTSGCCPTAMADITYNLNRNILPPTVADYSSSIGGATQGGASYHSTPIKLGKHYGFNSKEVGTMTEFLKLMKTGKYYGVLLFRSGSRGGVKWTSGGHYIACTDIRGADELYMRDSGQRNHTGWYSYSKYMKGLIKKAYAFEMPIKNVEPEKTANQKAIEAAVAYAKSLASNNTYGYKAYDSTDHMCPICHPSTKVKGFNCIGLVAACYAHGAKDKTILENCKNNNGSALGNNKTITNVTLVSWKKKNGPDWTMISSGSAKNSKSLDVSQLKAGDILLGYDTSGKYKHTMLYIGNGQLVDAKSRGAKAEQIEIRSYSSRSTNMRISRAFRYTGKGGF